MKTTVREFAEKNDVTPIVAGAWLQYHVKKGAGSIVDKVPAVGGGKGRASNVFEIPDMGAASVETKRTSTADFATANDVDRMIATNVLAFLVKKDMAKVVEVVHKEGVKGRGTNIYEIPVKVGELAL